MSEYLSKRQVTKCGIKSELGVLATDGFLGVVPEEYRKIDFPRTGLNSITLHGNLGELSVRECRGSQISERYLRREVRQEIRG